MPPPGFSGRIADGLRGETELCANFIGAGLQAILKFRVPEAAPGHAESVRDRGRDLLLEIGEFATKAILSVVQVGIFHDASSTTTDGRMTDLKSSVEVGP